MIMLRARAYAKINWALDVLGMREDGYHRLDMLMQSLSLCDTLDYSAENGLSLWIDGQPDFCPEQNLVFRAARLLQEETGCKRGARIHLHKRIPARAGLGGGSADCAATLRALNRLWQLRLSDQILLDLGAKLGADVPFCLHGGLMRVRGIGEQLTPLVTPKPATLLVVMPDAGLQTYAVFHEYDACVRAEPPVDMESAQAALLQGNYEELDRCAHNVLTAPAKRLSACIAVVLERLRAQGAVMARMSGSGSAVFGVFTDMPQAQAAQAILAKEYAFCEVVHTWDRGVLLEEGV